jgi:hypothetical protein
MAIEAPAVTIVPVAWHVQVNGDMIGVVDGYDGVYFATWPPYDKAFKAKCSTYDEAVTAVLEGGR